MQYQLIYRNEQFELLKRDKSQNIIGAENPTIYYPFGPQYKNQKAVSSRLEQLTNEDNVDFKSVEGVVPELLHIIKKAYNKRLKNKTKA